jgi:hypothetical protein
MDLDGQTNHAKATTANNTAANNPIHNNLRRRGVLMSRSFRSTGREDDGDGFRAETAGIS